MMTCQWLSPVYLKVMYQANFTLAQFPTLRAIGTVSWDAAALPSSYLTN